MLRHLWSKFSRLVKVASGERTHRPGQLNEDSLVVDLGVHKGEFSRLIATEYGCSVLGVEANPQLFNSLPALPRARFLNQAIHSQDAPVTFHVSKNLEASSISQEIAQSGGGVVPVTVRGITLDTLFKENAVSSVDLLKVDIECGEFPMLELTSAETLARITQLTVEFHVTPASGAHSVERVKAIMRRLGQIGFRPLVMNGSYTDVLFLNTNRLHCLFETAMMTPPLSCRRRVMFGVAAAYALKDRTWPDIGRLVVFHLLVKSAGHHPLPNCWRMKTMWRPAAIHGRTAGIITRGTAIHR
jgi:FkbM family methyltransferase